MSLLAKNELAVINHTFSPTGAYNTITYPTGFTRDNCTVISQMNYDNANSRWDFSPSSDASICRLKGDGIEVYSPNSTWTKCRILLVKIT